MSLSESIYLDYAAATPVDDQVFEAMRPYLTECFANPSASYAPARVVKAAVEDARARIAGLMGAKPASITFTAGATEANNLALHAASDDAHIVVSAIEHDSIRACVSGQGDCSIVPVTAEGFVCADVLADAICPQTELVSIALANGEIGTIQPMRELSHVVKAERRRRLEAGERRPIYLHTDASQSACLNAINVSSLEVDLITLSAAKLYGPKQVGLLWARSGIELHPLICGGGQENGLRSGTENVAGIIGFARAFELAAQMRSDEAKRIRSLRNRLQADLLDAFPHAVVSGPVKDAARLDNLLHISFAGIEARRLVILLDQRGVFVGTGSACAASKMVTSPVLEAIGMDHDLAQGSLRITLGRMTDASQVDRAAQIIIECVQSEYERRGAKSTGAC